LFHTDKISRNLGFTLVELMVVLLIGSLMLALVPPLMSGLGLTTETRGAARQLAAGLRAARNHAITKQEEAILTLDLEQRRFSVTGDSREIDLPDDEDVQVKLFTAQSELIDDTTGRVRFFPDGSSTGGHISLIQSKVEYRVNIDWLTGHIVIEDRIAE
jgi:general secretion pathway protein H